MEEGDRILDVAAGKHNFTVATEQGKIYASSYIFYRHFEKCRFNTEKNEDYPFELKLPDPSFKAK